MVGGVCAAYQLLGDAIWGTSNAKMIFDGTLDIIRFDAVGAVEDLIYNNAVGEWINANSTIKIDSALADALKGAGVKITEIAAAAVLSYFTCGAAAVVLPMLFGFLEGVGESAENYAKTVNREDGAEYDYLKAVTKSLSGGISKAAQWYGYGKMGSTLINAASNLGKSAASMTLESAKNIITNSAGSYGKAFAKNLFEFGNFLEVASTVAPHVSALINGEESWKDFLIGCSVELGISTAMNLLSAGLAAKGDMKSLKQAQDYIVDNCFKDLDDAQTAIIRGLISGNGVDDNALKSLMCNLDDDQFRLLKELDGVDSKIGQMYDSYGSAFKAIDSASGLDDASRT